jgi:PAS domain S-box-containing protein
VHSQQYSGTAREATAEVLVNRDEKIVAWSPEAEKIFRCTIPEVVGKPISDFLRFTDIEHLDRHKGSVPPVKDGSIVIRRGDGYSQWGWARIEPAPPGSPSDLVRYLIQSGIEGDELDFGTLKALFSESPIGLAIFDVDLRLRRYNPSAENLKGIFTPDSIGLRPSEIWPRSNAGTLEPLLNKVLESGIPMIGVDKRGFPPDDPKHEYVFSASAFPLHDQSGRTIGFASTAFDITARRKAEESLALIADAGHRVGTTLDVLRTGQELADLVVPRFADVATVDILSFVLSGEEPTETAPEMLSLRRIGQQRLVDAPAVADGHHAAESRTYPYPPYAEQCLDNVEPALLAIDMPDAEGKGYRFIKADSDTTPAVLCAPLYARGVKLGVVSFYRFNRPFESEDVETASAVVSRAGLSIDNARRYYRDHTIALSLKLDLMAGHSPSQSALEVSDNITAVVGGGSTDWLDIIPVSGARVALAVGSVLGSGLYAAAAMGRLRTAIHALSELDLRPDELLARLESLVRRISDEREIRAPQRPEQNDGSVTGATCLYTVYDPTSGHLSMASASHPLPIILDPDGNQLSTRIPPGGSMGSEHEAFGVTDVEIPAGSTVALYTSGLLNDYGTDKLVGLLRHETSRSRASAVDDIGAETMRALLPVPPDHDAVLLLARTQLLGEDRVVTWDLPSDPAAVATVRSLVGQQLEAWNLGEMSFATQLVASELVTNAIRYGKNPISLRLLRDRSLICEVSDGSATAPHLRYAQVTEEGGRGLFMTAELTKRWGTRYTEQGKTIWTEQEFVTGN